MKLIDSEQVQYSGIIVSRDFVKIMQDDAFPSSREYIIELTDVRAAEKLMCGRDATVNLRFRPGQFISGNTRASWDTESREVLVHAQLHRLFGRVPFSRTVVSIEPAPVK